MGVGMGLLIALGGCGGQGVSDGPTRGEGDIPIGRAKVSRGPLRPVRIDCAGGTTFGTIDASGTVWASPPAAGEASISIMAEDPSIEPVTIPITFGAQQRNLFDASLSSRGAGAVVRSIAIDLVGPMPIAVGQIYTIRVRVDGDNLNGVKPTVWVDDGVGALGANDRFTVTNSGIGEIRAQLYGVVGSTSVNVP